MGNFVEGLLSLYKSLIIRVGERKFYFIFALGSESTWDESSRELERKYVGTKVRVHCQQLPWLFRAASLRHCESSRRSGRPSGTAPRTSTDCRRSPPVLNASRPCPRGRARGR